MRISDQALIILLFAITSSFGQGKKYKVIKTWNKRYSISYTESNIKSLENPVHKENVNRIVFSNEEIEINEYDKSNLITDHNYGDPLFFRAFLDKSFHNQIVEKAGELGMKLNDNTSNFRQYIKFKATIYKNGEKLYSLIDYNDYRIQKLTFFGCMHYPKNLNRRSLFDDLIKFALKDKSKEMRESFKMKIVIEPIYEKESENPYIKVLKEYDFKVEGELNWIFSKERELELVYSRSVEKNDWKKRQDNKPILDKTLAIYKAYDSNNDDTIEEFLFSFINSSDWHTSRHEISGRILNRYINIIIVTKRKDGTTYIGTYKLYQEHNGLEYDALKDSKLTWYESNFVDVPEGFADYMKKRGH